MLHAKMGQNGGGKIKKERTCGNHSQKRRFREPEHPDANTGIRSIVGSIPQPLVDCHAKRSFEPFSDGNVHHL